MDDQNFHYRHIVLFLLKKKKKAKICLKREITCVLCTEKMQFQYFYAKRWFEKFWSGILSVKHSSRPVRSTEINTDKIKMLVDEKFYFTARGIAGDFQISRKIYHY